MVTLRGVMAEAGGGHVHHAGVRCADLRELTVPSSLAIEHDAVGSDHDSVGLFQQRPSWAAEAPCACMDPAH
jgi:hypothetical protein